MNVQYNYSIVDKRKGKDFTSVTYSGYKKIDVIKQLEKYIMDGNLEAACYWFIELHISGKIDAIWKIVFGVMSKNINIYNPNLASWLWLKYKRFCIIIKKFNKGYEYESRNNQEMRNLLVDIITILVYSNKSKILEKLPKVTNNDFAHNNIVNKMISKNLLSSQDIINVDDDKELQLAINEIINQCKLGNTTDMIYWYIWLDKIEKFKKTNNIEFHCKRREIKGVSSKCYGDWVWLVWKIILQESQHNDKLHNEIIALYNIYKWKYSKTTRGQKQYIIFHAFLLIKEHINWHILLINKYEYRIQACCNINQLYKLKKYDEPIKTNPQIMYEEKLEYKKINKIVNTVPEIKVKTQMKEKAKPFKIKTKDNDKEREEAIMMEKLDLFNRIILYKKDYHRKSHHRHHRKKINNNEIDNEIYNEIDNKIDNKIDNEIDNEIDNKIGNNELDNKVELKNISISKSSL